MSSIKVSALTAKTTPAGTEELLINDSGVSKKITIANLPDTNTTYSVGDGGLTEINFTSADNTKLDAIEASADVTDTTNVTAAGALMDGEVTNLAQVKAFDTTDYATSTQGTTADNALPKAGGTLTGDLTITDTTDDSYAGPELSLARNSTSPADGDYLGQLRFDGKSDTGTSRLYAKMTGKTSDVSNGSEDGLIETAVRKDGTLTIVARQTHSALKLINDTGLEVAGNITVTGTVDGRDVATDGTKLDTVATSANNYTHPTGDGNLHVPANGTTNNGKYLQASATAGTYTWEAVDALPTQTGNAGKYLTTDATTASWATLSTALVSDTTPQLGGTLDCNGFAIDFGDWTITETTGVLYFATGGVNKMKLDASGNLTVVGDVTASGTI
jgi:hypothetical protein